MEDARNLKQVALVAEEDSVVLGAETEEEWLYAPELLYVTLARERIARERFEYLQGDGLVYPA
jgi:hypothetical protein